jgi:hypothetical protein
MSVDAPPSTPRVFICYRRQETAAHAGRLYDAMVSRFGERNVFMDVDLAPGVDFVQRITEVVSACKVLIVVMGPSWATVEDEDGEPRIVDPDDFVRLELETAIRRPEVTAIPVLVGGARMPRREDLPPELQAITRRNALELSDARWGYDVGRLNSALDELLVGLTRPRSTPAPEPPPPASTSAAPEPSRLGPRPILEGVLVAGLTAYVARRLFNPLLQGDGHATEIAGVLARRAGTWALTAAGLALWLAIRTRRTDLPRLGLIGLLVGALAGALGAAIWAFPVILGEIDPAGAAANRYQVVSFAVTGGILGALLGALWRPPASGTGLGAGFLAAGLLFALIDAVGWDYSASTSLTALSFAIAAAVIVAATLAALLALDRRRSPAPPASG